MTPSEPELLAVEQLDRDAAAAVRPHSHNSALILSGERDATDIVQAAAHARRLATRSAIAVSDEVVRLREALEKIAAPQPVSADVWDDLYGFRDIARQALES